MKLRVFNRPTLDGVMQSTGDATEAVTKLKQQPRKALTVLGSCELCQALMRANPSVGEYEFVNPTTSNALYRLERSHPSNCLPSPRSAGRG